jgi:hypothetical protein
VNHPTTPDRIDLSRATINGSSLIIQLLREPDLTAADRQTKRMMVGVIWPGAVTIVPATTYGDLAAQLTRVFAESATSLARFKAQHNYL